MPKRNSEELEFKEKYTYNSSTDTYVINVKHRVKPLVLKGFKIRAIRRAICNSISPSETNADICIKYKIEEDDLTEIRKIFDLARDAFPLTDEEVTEQSVEQSVSQILDEKRTAIAQAIEKEEWKETQKEANNWRHMVARQLDPFQAAIDAWQPPKLTKALSVKTADKAAYTNDVLTIGLSDLHYGSCANSKYMFNRPDWSTEKTVEAVEKFAQSVLTTVSQRTQKFKKALILGLGDLLHSVNGKTGRGTELIYDCVREEQFDYALTSLTAFIQSVASAIPIVEVHSVYGNHNYEAEMALFRALEMYFKPNPNIKFKHYSSRPAAFREGSTLFLMDHGADSVERAYVPTGSDAKIQLHVQSLLMSNPELLVGAKERLFVMGDKHHWEHIEYVDFQFIMFGTIVGGDQHASVNNLRNRPRQTCLVIGDDGLREVIHTYFD